MSNQPALLELEQKPTASIDDLWNAADAANVALAAAEIAYLKAEEWIRGQRARLERIETNITLIVAAAKTPDDKAMFTNDTQRKAEVGRRLSDNPEYRTEMTALVAAEGEQAVRKIHIDKLGRDYSLAKLRFEALAIGKRYEH